MQSVTSNAVAVALGQWEVLGTDNSTFIIRGMECRSGIYLQGYFQGASANLGFLLPQKYRPKVVTRFIYFTSGMDKTYFCNINSDGTFYFVAGGAVYGDFLVRVEKTL